MTTTVDVHGAADAVVAQVKEDISSVNRQVVSRATRGLNAMRNAELDVLKGDRHGKVYKKPGGGTYTASAPGEPPARRTGNLRLNWNGRVDVEGSQNGNMVVKMQLESGTEYAKYLEGGTSRMAARPFVQPIAEKADPEIKKIYSEPYG